MDNHEVELLAIGAGPSNLALAVAIEELAPPDLALNSLVIEQHENVAWQRGMLLPWTRSQVSFLKDIVTMRNPRSKFTFINYLHTVGRLDDFVNMADFLPYRSEISAYLRWVAQSLTMVRVGYGYRTVGIDVRRSEDGTINGWHVRQANGSTITANGLVIGVGRDAHIPMPFRRLPPERLIHSSEYSVRIEAFDPLAPHRVVVLGAAQSAAEMLWETHQRMPNAQCSMVMRSVGLQYYQTSKFVNELYLPSFTDEFYEARPEARRQVLAEMRRTNYAGVTPEMLETLYRQAYLDRLNGVRRLHMITMVDVTEARMDGDEVVLTLTDRMAGVSRELRCDVVLLGTGFEPGMPTVVEQVAEAVGLTEVMVTRQYRVVMPPTVTASCYLQGTNESSHGISDSLMSVLAVRAGEIVDDVLANRAAPTLLASVAAPA